MCHSARTRSAAGPTVVRHDWSADRAPADATARIGDTEREEVVAMLGDAAAEGYLTADELDDRLASALTARTRGDLVPLTVDLPPEWRARRARLAAAATARRVSRAAVRPHVLSYLAVMALLVVIWLAVAVGTGVWYPWPIWPALFWGLSVLGHVRAARVSPVSPA